MSDLVMCENAANCDATACPHRRHHARSEWCEPLCGRGYPDDDEDEGWDCLPVEDEE